jgi:signal transduction histidine kinase
MKKKSLDVAVSGWNLVKSNLNRTLHLAMNMLTFSKERQPRIEIAQLNRIVEDVIALVQGRADEFDVMILAELEEIPAIPMDPEGIHQVAHNILINAIEAVPRKTGRVNLRTRYDAQCEQIVLSIGDNGPGIPHEMIDRIFDVFHSSKGHAGTGLGLAAARKIVAELGGRIDVESKIGEGTTFHVTLPVGRTHITDSQKTHGPGQTHTAAN